MRIEGYVELIVARGGGSSLLILTEHVIHSKNFAFIFSHNPLSTFLMQVILSAFFRRICISKSLRKLCKTTELVLVAETVTEI